MIFCAAFVTCSSEPAIVRIRSPLWVFGRVVGGRASGGVRGAVFAHTTIRVREYTKVQPHWFQDTTRRCAQRRAVCPDSSAQNCVTKLCGSTLIACFLDKVEIRGNKKRNLEHCSLRCIHFHSTLEPALGLLILWSELDFASSLSCQLVYVFPSLANHLHQRAHAARKREDVCNRPLFFCHFCHCNRPR